MKTIQDCIQFANDNPVCYLATVEGDQPRVRAVGLWYADETGFYFQTALMKEIPYQLKNNSKAEACFYHHEGMIGVMMRVAGSVEFMSDRAFKEKAIEDRPFLKGFGMTPDSEELILFRIVHGEAHFWTMDDNLKPKEVIKF